jgi:GR25 family glycosyltransferase involved in LPS biosynthesis
MASDRAVKNTVDWSFFAGRTYCINLLEREDRYREADAEFDRVGLHVEFYRTNRHPTSGPVGCYTSHINVMRMARDAGLSLALILEDDVVFDTELLSKNLARTVHVLRSWESKKHWDIFYLGHAPELSLGSVHNDGDFQIYRARSTHLHCYIVNLRSDRVLEFLGRDVPTEDRRIMGVTVLKQIDQVMRDTLIDSFAIYPMIAFQRSDTASDNDWGVNEIYRPTPAKLRTDEHVVINNPVQRSNIATNLIVRARRSFAGWMSAMEADDVRS